MVTEARREYLRQWHLKNREKRIASGKARYVANREKILAYTKQYHAARPEAQRKSWKKYQAANREKCRQRNREWYQRNLAQQRERVKVKQKKIYRRDRTKILAENRKWRQANKECVRNNSMKRKALLRGAAVNLKQIKEWMSWVKSNSTAICYYCGSPIPSSLVHFDHIVPLSKGGPHSIENLCVSCAACNLSKKATRIEAWVRIGQQFLAL